MRTKKLVFSIISIMVLVLLLGITKVNATTGTKTWIEGITTSLDIATTLDTDPNIFGNDGLGEPAITKEEFNKIKVTQLVRGNTYILWDGNTANPISNCTLSVNGTKLGTLEKTNTKLWGNFGGDGDICAYTLKINKDAILPTEATDGYYYIDTSIDNWTLLLPSNITLVDKETLQTNTITSNDNGDMKIGITGKISANAKLTSNEIVETAPEFQMMQTVITHHIENQFSQYNSEALFIKNIKIENGNFEGKLTLAFDIGTKYNDKKFIVAHQKSSNGEIEYFNGIVKNGQATIEVTEFSPFAISVLTEKEENKTPTTNNTETKTDTTPTTNKGEKDTTPKTGTIDIIGYVLVVTILSGIGIVALKKRI